MTKLRNLFFITVFAITMTACLSDDEPSNDDKSMYDIVTFKGNLESNNNHAVFQYQKDGDSRTNTLLGNIAINSDVYKENSRVLLNYIPESGTHNIDDNISIIRVTNIYNDTVAINNISKIPDWENNPIELYALWRAGKYINIQCGLEYTIEPAAFALVVDEVTINNEIPDLYIVYDKESGRETYIKPYYASIDISNIWNRQSCKGIRIHVNDKYYDKASYEFKKTALTPIN